MELYEALSSTLDTLTISRAAKALPSEQLNAAHSGAAIISADPAAQPAVLETEAADEADLRFLRSKVLRLRLALAARMAPAQLPDLAAQVCLLLKGYDVVSSCNHAFDCVEPFVLLTFHAFHIGPVQMMASCHSVRLLS